MVTLSIDQAKDLVRRALVMNRTEDKNARSTANALVNAEADNQKGHGLSRVSSYAAQSHSGKVNGFASPEIEHVATAGIRIDGQTGFAYPAIDLAIQTLPELVAKAGIAVAAIYNSHHFGQAGAHVERLAERGLVAILFGNTPKAIAFWGSSKPMMGTNPIAFAAPLCQQPPLVIDLSLSVAARGKIMAAKKAGEKIPEGWALDIDGMPTTEPDAALTGSMLPAGDAKGAVLALMVEILSAALTGANFGFEADSLFDADGEAPRLGQLMLVFDPDKLSGGGFTQRMSSLLDAINSVSGSRIPGVSRLTHRKHSVQKGLCISEALHEEILALAGEVRTQ